MPPLHHNQNGARDAPAAAPTLSEIIDILKSLPSKKLQGVRLVINSGVNSVV